MYLKKENKIVISIILSFIIIIGLTRNYIAASGPLFRTNSIFSFMVFILLVYFIYFSLSKFSKRLITTCIPSSLILAVCQRVGCEFSLTHHINFKSMSLYFSVIMLSILYMLLIALFLYYKNNIQLFLKKLSINKLLKQLFYGKYSYLLIFLIIIIAWIPAFLAVFPGIYSYDAGPQVLQVYGGQGLSAHHPIIHTLLLNGCFYFGNLISGDYNVGLVIYTIIQAVIMASCFTYAINKIKIFNVPVFVQFLALLFFSISPINQIWVMLTTKDTIFAGIFLVVLVDVIEIIMNPDIFLNDLSKQVQFIIKVILMCLFRNQGIYVFLLMSPFMLFALKKYWKKILMIILTPIISVEIIFGPISSFFDIKPSNPREALSVPIQQIARVINLAPETVTDKEMEVINRYLPDEYIEQYNPYTSDYVKEGFNAEYFKKDKGSFFKVWFSLLIKEPSLCIDSFLYGSYGYFYTDDTPYWISYILFDGAWLDENYNILNIKRNSLFPLYENYLRKVSVYIVQDKIPVVSTLLSQAFPFLLLIFILADILYEKKYKVIIPLLLVFGFWGTMLLGPLIAIRYAFPIIVCVPIMFSLLFFDNVSECEYNNREIEMQY